MRLAKILAAAGFLIMAASILYGITAGNFGAEGQAILDLVWGRVTLIDIYVSFFIFCGWIVFRERSVWRSVVLVALMIVLGSLTACGYLWWALHTSEGDWRRFWFGRRLDLA